MPHSERRKFWRRPLREAPADPQLEDYQELLLSIQSILHESLSQKDQQIRSLQEEVRDLRDILEEIPLDPRFWIGLPIGPLGPCGGPIS